ncbi:MAG: molybdopterin-dependent oxidoreductase [Dehalococcoidia bacterium]|nr:molybdopterin-dependent oxidoreductase [Dehalococcoidia bacterium]
MPDELSVIGKALPRPGALPIVNGTAVYVRDLKMPGMLRTHILRSPHAHANIKSIDTTAAEQYPGVAAVLTYKNLPSEWPAGYGSGNHIRILNEKVRFVGDPVAVVAAETQAQAEAAIALIKVEYEELPAVFTIEDALRPGAPVLHEAYPSNTLPEAPYEYGDVDAAFAQPDVVTVEATSSFIAEIPSVGYIEDCGTIAWWEDDRVIVIRTTQNSPTTLSKIAQFTGLPVTKMRVMSPRFVGGSSNIKENALKDLEFAVTLSKLAGRPVGVFLSKEESFLQYHKERMSISYKFGLKPDGTLVAVDGAASGEGAAYNYTASANAAATHLCYVAYFPNLRFSQLNSVFTNNPPGGGCRGYIYQEAEWTAMHALQQAMETIDIDPYEFYMKNTLKLGTLYYYNKWLTCDCDPITIAAAKAATAFDWKDKWQGWQKPSSVAGHKVRGVGIGWGGNGCGNFTSYTATVALSNNGTVSITPSEDEFGNGNRTNPWRQAAEVLKIPLDSVKGPPADTDAQPFYAWQTACGTFSIGRAIKRAAEDVRRQLLEMAAPTLGVKAEELDTKDRIVYVKANPTQTLTWSQIIPSQTSIVGTGTNIAEQGRFPEIICAFAEVEIDTETGDYELVNAVLATDVGQIVSPQDCEQQMIWSLVMDGTREAYVQDKATGRVLNPNYLDCKSRTFADLPNFESIITETPVVDAPYGAKSLAECIGVPLTPAITMAIYNATGKLMDLPIGPDKILAALGKA